MVPAEVGTVLAFYRRELAARHWKEETQGAVVKPDEVTLNFSSPEGTAVLKLGHKYDLTSVSLVLQVAETGRQADAGRQSRLGRRACMKQAQQMMREATADARAGMKPPKAAPAPTSAVSRPCARCAENKAPVPVPDTAEDVEFDGADGKLEFSSASSLKAVADFYRSAMKAAGLAGRSLRSSTTPTWSCSISRKPARPSRSPSCGWATRPT